MLAAFNGALGWTAVGTLTLAIVTGVSLAFAWASLAQNQRQIELSRREVEEAHRPVVVPVLIPRAPETASTRSSRHTLPRRPSVVDVGVLAVPLQNIGSGPALNVEASVKQLDADGNEPTGPRERQTPGTLAGIGKGDIAPIEIFSHGWEERWSFELAVTYEDVAGKAWTTVDRWNAQDGRYTKASIIETKASGV